MIIQLAKHIEYLGFGSTVGARNKRPIYVYNQPMDLSDAILIITGTEGEGNFDEELPGYYKAEIQVIVSASKILEAKALGNDLASALKLHNVNLGDGVVIKRCFPRHRPLVYTKNEGQVVEASVNYDIIYSEI